MVETRKLCTVLPEAILIKAGLIPSVLIKLSELSDQLEAADNVGEEPGITYRLQN